MTKKTPKRSKAKPTAAKPGPKADMLKLGGNWQDAVKQSLAKKKPASGWPK
jgi:hypothetical protein